VTEQHRFEHRFGQSGAIDRHERSLGARRAGVDETGETLFAGSGFAEHQYGRVMRGNARGELQEGGAFRFAASRAARGTDQFGNHGMAERHVLETEAELGRKSFGGGGISGGALADVDQNIAMTGERTLRNGYDPDHFFRCGVSGIDPDGRQPDTSEPGRQGRVHRRCAFTQTDLGHLHSSRPAYAPLSAGYPLINLKSLNRTRAYRACRTRPLHARAVAYHVHVRARARARATRPRLGPTFSGLRKFSG